METKKLKRRRTIDVLKGVCIIFVIIAHYNWDSKEKLILFFPFSITMAVPIFMIISGYVYTLSFQKNNINSLKEIYSMQYIVNKCLRFIVPYTIIYIFEIFYILVLDRSYIGVYQLFIQYFNGGTGPGGYYFPIMIQFIFLFPILWYVIKEYDIKGLNIAFVLNFVYEFLQKIYNLNEECYRLLIFRYIFVVAFGCYLAIGKHKIKKASYIILFFIGIFYVALFNYSGYMPIIMRYWTSTCCLCCLYILPIAQILISKMTLKCSVMELIGKASFNIFLVQKVYYTYFVNDVYALFESRLWELAISVGICILFGILFFEMEKPIRMVATEFMQKVVLRRTK